MSETRTTVPEAYHSAEIGQIVAALAEASKQFRNPVKNRTVTVYMKKTGGSFTFSYATLDHLLDIIRRPLADQGLIFTQIIMGRRLYSMLVHTSGEWFKSVREIQYDGGPQDFGSIVSYERRYVLQSMFGLAAEEDDDGVAGGAGDREIVTTEEAAARRQETEARRRKQEQGDTLLHPIQEAARLVKDADGGVQIISAWLRAAEEIERLRGEVDWPTLLNDVSAAIVRAFGRVAGVAWKSAAMATQKAHMDAIDDSWQNAWKDDLGRLLQEHPAGHARIVEHMKTQYARVCHDPATTPPRPPAPSIMHGPTTTAPAGPRQADPPPDDAPPDDGALDGWLVRDEYGEVLSPIITNRLEWARVLLDMAEQSNSLDNLGQHNECEITDALADHTLDAATRQRLRALLEGPFSPPPIAPITASAVIAVPKTALGGSDWVAYVRLMRAAIAPMTVAHLTDFKAANSEVFAGLPPNVQTSLSLAYAKRSFETVGI